MTGTIPPPTNSSPRSPERTAIFEKKVVPLCPHCEKSVERLIEVNRGWFALVKVYICPHCKKIVGMTEV